MSEIISYETNDDDLVEYRPYRRGSMMPTIMRAIANVLGDKGLYYGGTAIGPKLDKKADAEGILAIKETLRIGNSDALVVENGRNPDPDNPLHRRPKKIRL